MRSFLVVVLAGLLASPVVTLAQSGSSQGASADVLIAYYTMTGTTQSLAQVVARGAGDVEGVNVSLKPIEAVTMDDLREAEGVILGSPTYYANMAGPMKTFIDSIGLEHDSVFMGGKIGGAFATGGGSGGGKEHVIVSLLLAMINTGMMVAGPAYGDGANGYALPGAAATDPGTPDEFTETEVEDARRLGRRIGEIALTLAD
ncbi:MAG: flavodoxin family protein [Gammaproteobacteria bacterium]|nr:flavodoxin family protein [Gammaproteobacteria bacterium]